VLANRLRRTQEEEASFIKGEVQHGDDFFLDLRFQGVQSP
jgi:hypothetical protein